jgi:hypothetical protein
MQQTTLPDQSLVLDTKSIDAMRSTAVSSPPLPAALQAVAEEIPLRSRTELLANLLVREIDNGTAADSICAIWRGARSGDRSAVRLLMSLLEVRLSGQELLRRALVGAQMHRACRRAARGDPGANTDERRDLLESVRAAAARLGIQPAGLHLPAARERIVRRANSLLDTLLTGRIEPAELAWLVDVAELEMRATAIRLGEMAERVGAWDGRRIGILLPVLSKQEERIRDTRAILVKLPAPEDLVKRTPVLVTRLEDRGFDGLVREVGARPEGLEVARAMVLTGWRAPLAPELAFLAGIVRLLADRFGGRGRPPLDPARALLLTLLARRENGLGLDLTPTEMRACAALWQALGVEARPGRFALSWEARRYEPMLPEDGTPELTYPAMRRTPDLRVMVLANIQNESVMMGLMAMPRVTSLPGLIETIALRTRSIRVLLEIANRRELYTGSANRNVPRVLLWHPSNIPASALRKFVHVRFVDRMELGTLSSRGSKARPEVRQMAAAYLASLSSS